MYNFNNAKKFAIIVFQLIFVTILWHCENSDEPKPTPPVIPPQSSLTLDLSSLTEEAGSNIPAAKLSDTPAMMAQTNWQFAAFAVGFWTGVTTVTMSVPVAAFAATINTEPEYVGDLRWKWTKDFWIVYTAELYGKINGSKIDWEMYISREGVYTDYLWFTGESNINGTGGTWIFNESYDNQVQYLQVEWSRSDSTQADLRYEIIKTGAPAEGSYIYYAYNADNLLDCTCMLFNAADTINVDTEWSKMNRNGRVKSQKHFSDDLWHCWDENHDNVDCN